MKIYKQHLYRTTLGLYLAVGYFVFIFFSVFFLSSSNQTILAYCNAIGFIVCEIIPIILLTTISNIGKYKHNIIAMVVTTFLISVIIFNSMKTDILQTETYRLYLQVASIIQFLTCINYFTVRNEWKTDNKPCLKSNEHVIRELVIWFQSKCELLDRHPEQERNIQVLYTVFDLAGPYDPKAGVQPELKISGPSNLCMDPGDTWGLNLAYDTKTNTIQAIYLLKNETTISSYLLHQSNTKPSPIPGPSMNSSN